VCNHILIKEKLKHGYRDKKAKVRIGMWCHLRRRRKEEDIPQQLLPGLELILRKWYFV